MRRTVLLLAVVACGGGGGGGGARDSLAVPDSAAGSAQVPEPVPGRLVVQVPGAGRATMGGPWRARASTCEQPRALQVVTEGDSVDVLLLIFLPDTASPEREYPVLQLDSVPDGYAEPHARIGVQRLGAQVASYQGAAGSVDLEQLGRFASGRFEALLREAISWDTLRMFGRFADLPVAAAAPDVCGPTAER